MAGALQCRKWGVGSLSPGGAAFLVPGEQGTGQPHTGDAAGHQHVPLGQHGEQRASQSPRASCAFKARHGEATGVLHDPPARLAQGFVVLLLPARGGRY